jgi:plasmid stability protein
MADQKRRGPKQKQLPVALTPHLRRELEAAAARSGNSLGEEVRQRLFQSFAAESVDPLTRQFADAVIGFAIDIKQETGRNWHVHPAANRALRYAITARLARLRPAGDAVFAADELPANRILTSSVDPENIGTMIEAFNFRMLDDNAKQAFDRAREEIFEKFPELRKDHEL